MVDLRYESPETIEAKDDQRLLVERNGGPETVVARAKGGKNFTELPPEVLAEL